MLGKSKHVRLSLVLLLGVLGVLALAGCGGGPAIDRAVATELARQADAVASARNACAARTQARTLQRQAIAAINAGRIPAAYQETLQARVNELAASFELRCLPTPAPATTPSASPPVVVITPSRGHDNQHGDGGGDNGGGGGGD
jgi:hypothetical protein